MNADIRNIIFDLGGVIYNIDYFLTQQAFTDLGLKDVGAFYSQKKQSGIFDRFETGKMTSNEFIDRIKPYLNEQVTADHIVSAWNAMLLGLPRYRLDKLILLKARYRIFLLSNTNEIHMDYITNELKQNSVPNGLDPYFEAVYLSHEMGERKPDPEAFNIILENHKLVPGETLFIDDTQGHLEGAAQLGIHTLLNPTNADVFTKL